MSSSLIEINDITRNSEITNIDIVVEKDFLYNELFSGFFFNSEIISILLLYQ